MTVTNQNPIQEEIKRRMNSGNACYHSVQNQPAWYHMAFTLKTTNNINSLTVLTFLLMLFSAKIQFRPVFKTHCAEVQHLNCGTYQFMSFRELWAAQG
jgi:hypothetical protein